MIGKEPDSELVAAGLAARQRFEAGAGEVVTVAGAAGWVAEVAPREAGRPIDLSCIPPGTREPEKLEYAEAEPRKTPPARQENPSER